MFAAGSPVRNGRQNIWAMNGLTLALEAHLAPHTALALRGCRNVKFYGLLVSLLDFKSHGLNPLPALDGAAALDVLPAASELCLDLTHPGTTYAAGSKLRSLR